MRLAFNDISIKLTLKLTHKHNCIYDSLDDSIGYFFKLFKLYSVGLLY